MGRPRLYNQETAEKLLQFIADGLTVKDACFGVGVSTDTCSRWRREYNSFAEGFIAATQKQQWGSATAVAKYHKDYRGYRRRVTDQNILQRHVTEPLVASQEQQKPKKPKYMHGFPVRYGPICEDRPFEVCVVGDNPDRVEWLEREACSGTLILHHGQVDAYVGKFGHCKPIPKDDGFVLLV